MNKDLKNYAARMDGVQYTEETNDRDLILEAKENNIVIAFCASDDLIEFVGAIDDETGHTTFIDSQKKGILYSECDEDDRCPYFQRIKEKFGSKTPISTASGYGLSKLKFRTKPSMYTKMNSYTAKESYFLWII